MGQFFRYDEEKKERKEDGNMREWKYRILKRRLQNEVATYVRQAQAGRGRRHELLSFVLASARKI